MQAQVKLSWYGRMAFYRQPWPILPLGVGQISGPTTPWACTQRLLDQFEGDGIPKHSKTDLDLAAQRYRDLLKETKQ